MEICKSFKTYPEGSRSRLDQQEVSVSSRKNCQRLGLGTQRLGLGLGLEGLVHIPAV